MSIDKGKNKRDGVEALREAINRKDRIPLTHTPQDIAKDDIYWIVIEVFPDEVNKGKDSIPPDINPDTPYLYSDNPGKGRISLLKRSPSLHRDNDA